MHTTLPTDLAGVYAVPPLARLQGARAPLALDANDAVREHIRAGGVTRLLYGGNAFVYHITLDDYAELLGWMAGAPDDVWMIPSVGPSFGRALDQAGLVKAFPFPCAMLLPCADPRDADGLEAGARDIAQRAGVPLILYLKDRDNWGKDEARGLDAVGRLVADGVACAIKYAVVREDPGVDPYLEALLQRVDRRGVISGIGERPAVVHLERWQLTGFTTGSGCVAPVLSQAIFEACGRGDFETARALRSVFLPLEDRRDEWGPARVLHAAVALSGIAGTGPIPPFVSALSGEQQRALAPIAQALYEANGHRSAESRVLSAE
jgi:dihydrodipicolinate synthase/N-acetylneuraminate lyase